MTQKEADQNNNDPAFQAWEKLPLAFRDGSNFVDFCFGFNAKEGLQVQYTNGEWSRDEYPEREIEIEMWVKVKDLFLACRERENCSLEDWANICIGLFKISTRKGNASNSKQINQTTEERAKEIAQELFEKSDPSYENILKQLASAYIRGATEGTDNLRNKYRQWYKQWCKGANRNGAVLVGSSINEFFDYLDNLLSLKR